MEILRVNNYRIATISNAFTGTRPIKEGLAIEKRSDCGESYFVIAFANPGLGLRLVGDRILAIEDDEFKIFKTLADIAIRMVDVANLDEGCDIDD